MMKFADPEWSHRCASVMNWYINSLVETSTHMVPADRAAYVINKRNALEDTLAASGKYAALPTWAKQICDAAAEATADQE